MGYAQANGANCYCSNGRPFNMFPYLPLSSCASLIPHFVVFTFKQQFEREKEKLARVEVGSLDHCSLLKSNFVFRVIEKNDLRKRILSTQALPSNFKAFYKLQFIKGNNHLRPVDRPLQGEGPSPPIPPFFSLCSQPQRARGGGIMGLPPGTPPWPSAQACFSSLPCQGSTLHLAIGYRLFSPRAACVGFSQNSLPTF